MLIKVIERLGFKAEELKITKSEDMLFSEIANLLYSSAYNNSKSFDCEVIVKLPQLTYEGVDAVIMDKYFGEIKLFWDKYIHSPIDNLIQEHANFCSMEDVYPNEYTFMSNGGEHLQFDHCVVELL